MGRRYFVIELLEKMYYEEDQLEKQLTKELKRYPKGSLELQRSGKGIRWYWKCPDKEERRKWGKRNKLHLNGRESDRVRLGEEDHAIVTGLRNRRICRSRLKSAEKNKKWVKLLLEHYESSDEKTAIQKLKEPYKSLEGFEHYISQGHVPVQSENPYHRELLIHKNSVGEYFRSKAEMHISELLLSHGIPYRYEMKLEMPDGEKKYPDFVVKKSESGEKKYIEYFGMIDKEDYANSMVEKINWYLSRGFVPGKNVLFLYESSSSGMDLSAILLQINYFLNA